MKNKYEYEKWRRATLAASPRASLNQRHGYLTGPVRDMWAASQCQLLLAIHLLPFAAGASPA
jgi:hypothetical protein